MLTREEAEANFNRNWKEMLELQKGKTDWAREEMRASVKGIYASELRDVCINLEAQLKAKDEEIERLFGLITSLWQIIDDIDTYGDMAKSNDALFRSLVEKKQKERWKLTITTDGYEIMLKDKA